MKNKKFYYLFWLKSSRGTDEVTIRLYSQRQTKESLKEDVEDWTNNFGASHVSENYMNYGWKEISRLPRTRTECLAQFSKAFKMKEKWNNKSRFYLKLLSLPPFNGKKS